MSDDARKPAPEAAPFTAEDAMAFMQRMWNPFAMPMVGAMAPAPPAGAASRPVGDAPADVSGALASQRASEPGPTAAVFGAVPGMLPGMLPFPNPATMFAALDPGEVARKISELKAIEGWLAMSLNLVQMSVKTLELQLASLQALQGAHAPAAHKRTRRTTGG